MTRNAATSVAGEPDQPLKFFEFHCWPIGGVATHRINPDKDCITTKRERHACYPELVVWHTNQFVTVDNKLVFARHGRAMLYTLAPNGVLGSRRCHRPAQR